MISKIIQKEKERQDRYLKIAKYDSRPVNEIQGKIITHNQSLINLKEHLEEDIIFKLEHHSSILQMKEDIQELNKMIEKYG